LLEAGNEGAHTPLQDRARSALANPGIFGCGLELQLPSIDIEQERIATDCASF